MSEMKIGVNVDTGEEVSINLEKFIDTRAILTASSGGGKSWTVRKFLQESYGKVQQIILDWEGEYANLRPEFDYLLVGDDGEIPIQVKTAEILARKIMQLSVSTIIDLSDLSIHDRKMFTKNFLDSLLNLPKEMYNHSVLLFIDEAHLLCPQKGNSESMNSVINVNSTGRKRGIGTVLCTQRIAKLNKDAVAESRNGAMGGMGLLEDRKRACDEMGFNTKELEQSIKLLDTGVFYMYGPAISKEVIKVKIGDVKIKPPKPGQKLVTNDKTPEAIKKILQSLTDLPKEAETELKTKEDLKSKITELKREIAKNRRGLDLAKKFEEQKREIRELKLLELEYKKSMRQLELNSKQKISQVDSFHKTANKVLANEVNKLKQTLNKINVISGGDAKISYIEKPSNNIPDKIDLGIEVPKVAVPQCPAMSPNVPQNNPKPIEPKVVENDYEYGDEPLKPIGTCGRKIYSFLFANPGRKFSKLQVAFMTGYSLSGSFNNAIYSLTPRNLVVVDDSKLMLGDSDPSFATEKLEEFDLELFSRRVPLASKKILEILWENRYDEFSKHDLSERTGYSLSGSFNNAIYKLTGLKFALKVGVLIKINPEIFELE